MNLRLQIVASSGKALAVDEETGTRYHLLNRRAEFQPYLPRAMSPSEFRDDRLLDPVLYASRTFGTLPEAKEFIHWIVLGDRVGALPRLIATYAPEPGGLRATLEAALSRAQQELAALEQAGAR